MSDKIVLKIVIDQKGKIRGIDKIPTDIIAEVTNTFLNELTGRLKKK